MHRKNGLPCALVAWLAFGHIVRPARGSSAGAGALQWLLGEGMPLDTFFEQYWERRPLHIRRKNDKYYEGALAFSQDWFLGCVDKIVIDREVDRQPANYIKFRCMVFGSLSEVVGMLKPAISEPVRYLFSGRFQPKP